MPQTEVEPTTQQLEDRVKGLEEQVLKAQEVTRRTRARLAELAAKQREISPDVLSGSEQARADLDKLEQEQEKIEHSSRIAQSATPELQRMLEAAKQELAQERRSEAQIHASKAYKRVKDLENRRAALVHDIDHVLREHAKAYGEYIAAVREYSPEQANNLASNRVGMSGRWIKAAFAKWL
jgi:chromosome segregation ATPase